MHPHRAAVLATVSDPDFICKGDNGELKAVRARPTNGNVLVVVYKEIGDDGFVITAHLGREKTQRSLQKREIVWKRPNYTE